MSERYGQYELIKKLATGGMAQIYLARHRGIEGFERLCVVKRILPHLAENDDFVQMFLDEARIAARLNHPNIVQIYDLGQLDGSYFIAMEYLHGEDLRRVWRRSQQLGSELPIPFVIRVVADVCSGLDYAHKRTDSGRPLGIVHRDISPQNILVSFDGTVKVVDFGIAKAADKATHTRSGVLKGKYSYMAPEQAAGERNLDRRADIFATGVLLYELLTGQRLFKRNSDMQTLQAVVACVVPLPSETHPRVPKDLDAVVRKALAKSPADRYPDAQSFQLALENWLTEHQQPSSSAHLAGHMRRLYAEQLAQEELRGGPVAEELSGSASAEEKVSPRRRTPVSRSGRSPGSMRERSVPWEPDAAEPTTSLRPERSSKSPPRARPSTVPMRGLAANPELPVDTNPRATEVSRIQVGRRKQLALGMAALVLIGAAALGYAALRPQPVLVEAALPSTGPLEPWPEPVPDKVRPADPVEPAVVMVRLISQPPGASLTVNGQAAGSAPTSWSSTAGEALVLRAELAGHLPTERRIEVGDGPGQQVELVLERRRVASLGTAAVRTPDAGSGAATPPVRGMGLVRFVISPMGAWAEVSCNNRPLGQVPGMGDQQLPAGPYECTFTHPELGSRKERVEVKANDRATVTVRFNPR